MSARRLPGVPEGKLDDDWEERVRTEGTVFRTPTAEVVGYTVLYEDATLRDAFDAAGAREALAERAAASGDRPVETADERVSRLCFATGRRFRPPLAPGIGPASTLSTIVSEARRSFADDLRARGFVDVDRGPSQRVHTDAGDRARLAKFTATYPLDAEDVEGEFDAAGLDSEGWLAVWIHRGTFRVAGGAYPVRGLDALLVSLPEAERPDSDPTALRNELIDLIRGVA